jgi:DNA polymerase-1
LQESHTQILQTGAVRTLAQRIRSTTLHRHTNKAIREGAVRSVTNTIIQGSAADIVNSAMVGIANDARWKAMGSRIIMQVHDEIVANVPEQHAEDGAAIMKFYMCNPFGAGNYLRVPLMVEGAISHSWEK